MSEYIHKNHNVTVLLYHLVFPAKYRRVVFDNQVDTVVKDICKDLENRYQIKFLEIGMDNDHIYFLVRSIPTLYCDKDRNYDKESNGSRSFQTLSTSKEKAMGWRILDGWIFCKFCRKAWQ